MVQTSLFIIPAHVKILYCLCAKFPGTLPIHVGGNYTPMDGWSDTMVTLYPFPKFVCMGINIYLRIVPKVFVFFAEIEIIIRKTGLFSSILYKV